MVMTGQLLLRDAALLGAVRVLLLSGLAHRRGNKGESLSKTRVTAYTQTTQRSECGCVCECACVCVCVCVCEHVCVC